MSPSALKNFMEDKIMSETQVINVRLTLEEIKKIEELAKADERSRAYMIRKLIRQALGEFQRSD